MPAKKRAVRANAVDHTTAESAASQLEAFIDKFEPDIAALVRDCRRVLRKRMPTAHELVYDNYQFFVIGYASSPRASDCIVSLATNKHGVTLSFYYGAMLDDPDGVLEGSGKQNRFIRLPHASKLQEPAVESRIAAAIAQGDPPLPAERTGALIIKSVSTKQVPRR